MRYQNVAELLPAELLEALQGYLDGGYLYIPRRAEHRRAWGERTRRKEETLPATGPFSGTTPPVWAWTSCPPAIFSPQRASSGFSPWAAGACWSHSPAPERSTLRRSFFAVPSLRLPPRGPLCYNGRESEARYP